MINLARVFAQDIKVKIKRYAKHSLSTASTLSLRRSLLSFNPTKQFCVFVYIPPGLFDDVQLSEFLVNTLDNLSGSKLSRSISLHVSYQNGIDHTLLNLISSYLDSHHQDFHDINLYPCASELNAVSKLSTEFKHIFRLRPLASFAAILPQPFWDELLTASSAHPEDWVQYDLAEISYPYLKVESLNWKVLHNLAYSGQPLNWLFTVDNLPNVRHINYSLSPEARSTFYTHNQSAIYSWPSFLCMESTRLCNLKCTMCVTHGEAFDTDYLEEYPKHMDVQKYQKVLEELVPYKDYISINPQFQGEPFMSPAIKDFITIAKKLGFPVGFTSNAILWNPSIIKFLIENEVDSICISCDGNSEEVYNSIRVNGDFYRFISNLSTLIEMRDRAKRDLPEGSRRPVISINWTELPENSHEVETFISDWIKRVYHVSVNTPHYYGKVDQKEFEPDQRYPCPYLWDGMHVLTNGDVVPCCRDSKYEQKMGNIFDSGVNDVWNGEEYQRLRALHLAGRWDEVPICRQCDTWSGKQTKYKKVDDDTFRTQFSSSYNIRRRSLSAQSVFSSEYLANSF